MSSQLRELTRMRVLLFLREPEAVFWVFVFPIVLALVLGLAFQSQGVEPSPIGVLEGALTTDRLDSLRTVETLDVHLYVDDSVAARKLRAGAVDLLARREGGELTLELDPRRSEAELARLRLEEALARMETAGSGAARLRAPRRKAVTESGARYIDFLLPGLLGMNLMGTGIWGTGFALVDMRQKKLLRLLRATPMARPQFLLAQTLSRFLFLVAEVAVIVLFGVLALGVPFRGDLLSFSVMCVVGAFCFSGLGLWIASRATTIEGVSGLMNFVMIPMWLGSGTFFSYERFPEALHPLLRLLPLTALNDGLRAIMIEGESLLTLAPEVLIQVGWMGLAFLVALRTFRWQ